MKKRRITINVQGNFLQIPQERQPRFAEAAVEFVIAQGFAKEVMEEVIGFPIAVDWIFQATEKPGKERKKIIKKIKVNNDEKKLDHDETSVTKADSIKEIDNFKPESTHMKTKKTDDHQLSLL